MYRSKIDVHVVENIKFTVSDVMLCKLVDSSALEGPGA